MSKKSQIPEIALSAVKVTGQFIPIVGLGVSLVEMLVKSNDKIEKAANSSEIESETQKNEAKANVARMMAIVQQELAIASRIATADEVSIEEYFDGSGDGNLGLKMDEGSVSIGAGGSGRKITKRVLRFKGWRVGIEEQLDEAVARIEGDLKPSDPE